MTEQQHFNPWSLVPEELHSRVMSIIKNIQDHRQAAVIKQLAQSHSQFKLNLQNAEVDPGYFAYALIYQINNTPHGQ